jgi:predicted alpha/beta superfamily hydrolase
MIKYILFISFLFIGIISSVGCSRKNFEVFINVTVPPDTPPDTQLFIAGNHRLLGNWGPDSVKMEKESDSLWSFVMTIPRDYYLEFKITRGSWNTQAVFKKGEIPPNTTLTVRDDTVINLRPVGWQDFDNRSGGGIVGEVEYHRGLTGDNLRYPRDIIVLLPPSYRKDTRARYPVLYMHDGQNVIDPSTSFIGYDWHVDEISDSLISAGKMKEIIVVGISNTPDRRDEYGNTALGQAYMTFIIKKLKPFIDSTYRTIPDRENSAIMGSSMGGLISFLLVWNYPEVFSRAGCLSPAFFGGIIDSVKQFKGSDKKINIYLDNGGKGLEEELQPGCEEMMRALKNIGFVEGGNLTWYRDLGAEHNERAWAARLWRPLLFMFGK